MKLLIIGIFHHKNMVGLELLLKSINFEYKYGNIDEVNEYDIIYSPNHPINSSKYPNGTCHHIFPLFKFNAVKLPQGGVIPG